MKSILNGQQEKLMARLSKNDLFDRKFYLTGGTALSEYYLHHRSSEDLDYFSMNEVDELWLATLVKSLKEKTGAVESTIEQSFNRNLVFFKYTERTVKMEFTYFPFAQIEKPQLRGGIRVDSLIDIAVNKFFTIYQKPSARHFIDLYLILKKESGFDWEKLGRLARVKFDTNIDPIQLGSQLVVAENISDLPIMVAEIKEEDWRDYFVTKAEELKGSVVE